MDFDRPAAAVLLEGRDRGIEPVGERIGQPSGGGGIGRDAGEMALAHPCHSGLGIGVQNRSSLRSSAIAFAAL